MRISDWSSDVCSSDLLTIMTGARAERIVFSGRRTTGVLFVRDGAQYPARVRRELILSGGSNASNQLLQVSGVGAGARLHTFGTPVVHDLPGVGENLQEPPHFPTI